MADNNDGLKDIDDLGVSPVGGSNQKPSDSSTNKPSKADKLNNKIDTGLAAAGGAAAGGGGAANAGSAAGSSGKSGGAGKLSGGASGGDGLNKALDQIDKHAPDKNHQETEGDKYAKAAGKAAGAGIGAAVGGSAGAQVGAKVGEQATKNGRWKWVGAAIIAPTVIAIAIPIFIIAYIINNPWDAVREVLTNSSLRSFGLEVAKAFGKGALEASIRALTYTGEVDYHGPNTAIAVTAGQPIAPGSTLEKLSKIDWKKAQYQTLNNESCGYKLNLKQVVNSQGQTRYVPDNVLNKRTRAVIPLNQLNNNLSALYCIQKQYPIFNIMARQPVTREINQQADVHLNYASKKDTEEFRGSYEEVNKYVYDKTIDRITPSKSETISFESYAGQLTNLQNAYRQAVQTYNSANPSSPINYSDERSNLQNGINKMFEDMSSGKSPYSLQVEDYINIPTQDTGNSPVVTSGLANTLCPFIFGFLDTGNDPTNEEAAKNARAAIESRLASTERGAIKINTLADTRKADQLSNVENNSTIRQQDNWASSTAYQLDVYSQLRGVEQNPEATSTRSYNAKQTELNADPSIAILKVSCIFSSSNVGFLNDAGATLLPIGYNLLKQKIVDQSQGVFTSTSDFGLKEIITSFVRTGSVTAVSGLEDGPDNYNRQAAGFRQLMNDYYLRIGGRFLTNQEAQQLALESNNIRNYQEKQGGIAYRLFDTTNTRSARSIISHNTTSPKTAVTASLGIFKQLVNPLKSLANIHSSINYYATGTENKAFAASITMDQYLKIDTAGIPNQDFNIDMLENAPVIENIKNNGSDSDKLKLAHYDECFKKKIPTTQYFKVVVRPIGSVPDNVRRTALEKTPNARFVAWFEFFPQWHKGVLDENLTPASGDNPDGDFNKFYDCKVILELAQDFNNPAYQLPIRYRMYTYYNTLLDQMVTLSSDEPNSSIYAGASASTTTTTGPVDGGADTSNIPCPSEPGITDGPIEQTYGPGRVPQNRIHICNVQGIQVNVSIAHNLNKLINDARAAGINFGGGGFRSYDQQRALRVAHGCPDDSQPSSACSPPTAPPGHSLHEKGLAIDFSVGGSTISSGSPGFNWLVAHAREYGLQNLPSESWHWSINGS